VYQDPISEAVNPEPTPAATKQIAIQAAKPKTWAVADKGAVDVSGKVVGWVECIALDFRYFFGAETLLWYTRGSGWTFVRPADRA